MTEFIANFFKIKENNTTIKTELLAGLTTFFTMSYLFILSPKILSSAGLDFSSTLTITALFIFIGCIFMGFFANKPYAVAPFLGETAFIAFTICSTTCEIEVGSILFFPWKKPLKQDIKDTAKTDGDSAL